MILDPGNRLDIPDLHLYFLLAQILPISFTQNLFLLVVLLHGRKLRFQAQPTTGTPSIKPPSRSKSTPTSAVESPHGPSRESTFAFHLLVVPALTQLLLLLLQLAPKTLEPHRDVYLIPLVLATRVVLFLPFPLMKVASIHRRLEDQGGRWAWLCVSGVAAADMAVRTRSVLMKLNGSEKQGSILEQLRSFLQTQLGTLNEGSAIAALGWDLIIGLFSAMIYWAACFLSFFLSYGPYR